MAEVTFDQLFGQIKDSPIASFLEELALLACSTDTPQIDLANERYETRLREFAIEVANRENCFICVFCARVSTCLVPDVDWIVVEQNSRSANPHYAFSRCCEDCRPRVARTLTAREQSLAQATLRPDGAFESIQQSSLACVYCWYHDLQVVEAPAIITDETALVLNLPPRLQLRLVGTEIWLNIRPYLSECWLSAPLNPVFSSAASLNS